eukprot:1141618-Pelagomonas_calceolata.AAC.3
MRKHNLKVWATVGDGTEEACTSSSQVGKNISGKAVTLHTILQGEVLGVGGTCYTEHTLNKFKQLGLYHQRAIKLARKLHTHSV